MMLITVLKILNCTDLHTSSLQTSQDQIYQETSNKTADDFWKCNSIENCLYRITQQMKPLRLITGMPRAPRMYNRYFIETFIIRDKVLQHSVSHTFRCSDSFPLILFNTAKELSTYLYTDNTKASTVSIDNTTMQSVQ